MRSFMKKWFCMGFFICVFCVYQMFFAIPNRVTIFFAYFTNLILFTSLMYHHYIHWKLSENDAFLEMKKQSDRFDALMKDFPHRCIWKCDICNQERIDALIGVSKYQDESKVVKTNIKYCLDNNDCIKKSKTLEYCGSVKVYLMADNDDSKN